MIFYPCKKKTQITRSGAINIEGKFALDAIENNPSIDNSLANRIDKCYQPANPPTGLSSIEPILSVNEECDEVKIGCMRTGTNDSPPRLCGLVDDYHNILKKYFDFRWYSRHWRAGLIRGGSTDTLGFGIGIYNQDNGDNLTNIMFLVTETGGVVVNDLYTNSGTVLQRSDKNKKKNIEDVDIQFANKFINKLNPVSFEYIDDENHKTHYGLIAQDVEELLEELGINSSKIAFLKKDLKDDNPEYYLGYVELINILIKYVQGLKKEVDNLKEEVKKINDILSM